MPVQVHPTHPPLFAPAVYSDTRASRLRRRHMRQLADSGQFGSLDAKEQRVMAVQKQEMQRRAKAHVAMEQRKARQNIRQAMHDSQATTQQVFKKSGVETTDVPLQEPHASRLAAQGHDVVHKSEDRLAEAHRQSRYNKIEADISNMTRDILAEKGLDVLRFVEDRLTPKQMLDAIKEHVPHNRAEVRMNKHVTCVMALHYAYCSSVHR